MKKIALVIVALTMLISIISCDEVLPGIGDSTGKIETYPVCGTPYLTDNITDMESMPPETVNLVDETEIEELIEVSWSDFVRVGGVSYQGDFYGKTVEKSLVGEKIGEILYNVKSSYSSREEMRRDESRDMTASFRTVGCEIFKVKNDENSIAVLDDGKYYIYTRK